MLSRRLSAQRAKLAVICSYVAGSAASNAVSVSSENTTPKPERVVRRIALPYRDLVAEASEQDCGVQPGRTAAGDRDVHPRFSSAWPPNSARAMISRWISDAPS
jgi:hypothetical protein